MNRLLLIGVLLLAPALAAAKSSVLQGKHNLSMTGPGSIRSSTEKRACIFCHTPHRGTAGTLNRPPSTVSHRHYRSSTMQATGTQGLTGSSRTCVSCHDGTVAVGQTVASGYIPLLNTGPGGRLPAGHSSNLGTDLTGSHPVSIKLQVGLKAREPTRGDPVKLDRQGLVQCTSCHDPHSEDDVPTEKKFLLKPTRNSELCSTCHSLPYWSSSSHQLQTRNFSLRSVSPTLVSSMEERGCGSCHAQHNAKGARLVKGARTEGEDQVCLSCHDSRTAPLDLTREALKPFAHAAPVAGPSGHDASESPLNQQFRLPESHAGVPRHVTCVDCHEAHSVNAQSAVAPRANGALTGVWGIDRNGQRVETVSYEYEVCFKCHADSLNQPQLRGSSAADNVRRLVNEVNLRRVFDPNSPSFHPVVAPGKNTSAVPSLIPPLTTSSQIYCTDCHASDGAGQGSVPRGPHGSIYPHLLERNYATADHTPESPNSYALCYKCHDRARLLSSQSSFSLHRRHVVDQSAPCSACHNAHGVAPTAGTPQNNAHLIDFDLSIVRPLPNGMMRYTSNGSSGGGTCSLTCHGSQHNPRSYSALTSSAAPLRIKAASH
ncbi:MAG TPA: cytochrome c3 family protein [Anaeromyxobacteraceae bacterium]|jgi:predicted CXXCH cytochrome family protein|nr:cytochrome c3 family protein [Anaeromyxobacteraceae bacterium]